MVTERSRIAVYDSESDSERRYWIERLSRERGVSNLVLDYKRPRSHCPERETFVVTVGGETLNRFLALTKESPFLIYTALLTTLNICLHKYTGSTAVVVGSPPRLKNEPVRPNALTILTNVEPNLSVRELMLQVREVLIEAYAKQNYPYESLVRHLGLEKIENQAPLFDIVLMQQDLHGPLAETRNDITITFEKGEQLVGTVAFNADLFSKSSVEQFMRHFLRVLDQCLEDSNKRVADIQLLSEAERDRLLHQEDEIPVPVETVVQLFEQQVERAPQAIAAVFADGQATYEQLNDRANQLASSLCAFGVRSEVLVAICVERSLEMLVGIIGILKAGGAYVPLDPAYPKERLAFILEDTAVEFLITQKHLRDRLPEQTAQVIYVDQDHKTIAATPTTATHDNLAYVVYTSGSTGTPKGVMIQQRALASRTLSLIQHYDLKPGERLLQFVSLSFDAMAEEIFPTLASGATLVLHRNPMSITPMELMRDCEQLQVSILHIPPSYWQPLMNDLLASGEPVPKWIKLFITGGERISVEKLARWIRQTRHASRIVNAYGPTEATITSTLYEVPMVSDSLERLAGLPIGRAIENTPLYLLDLLTQPVPAGVPGELYIGGIGLARGYLNDPASTAERFIPDPFAKKPGSRLYRTGDRARYLSDGNIDFLDRLDDQIKIRGFRVEPREIESKLSLHPAVANAVITSWEQDPDEKLLVAYTVPRDGHKASAGELRSFLREQLPDYMVPTLFVSLDQLPLTANGKVDRKALPPPLTHVDGPKTDNPPPQTPVEEVLAGIYAEILKTKPIGRHQGFFELGGHSLLATQVVSRVREIFQVELSVRTIFETPEIDRLARTIETARQSAGGLAVSPIVPAPRNADLPLSFSQQRLWFLHQLDPDSPAYNFPTALRLKGKLHHQALRQTLAELISRHESLRTTFPVVDARPVQLIHPPSLPALAQVDLQEITEADRESLVQQLITEHAKRPFNLSSGPLLRVVLFKIAEDEHVLLLTMHHIITDGWSLGVLIKETSALYEGFMNSKRAPLAPLPIQYADVAFWQHQWLQSENLSQQLDYWKQALAGAPAALHLPTDFPRPGAGNRGTTHAFTLSASLSTRIREVSQAENVTLFMFLLAAFQLLLHSYTGQDNIVVGTNIANRNRSELELLIGVFINDLALHTDLSGIENFRQLLQRVREVTLGAYDHQEVPFEMVLEVVRREQRHNDLRLFQVFFVLQNLPLSNFKLPDLTLSPLELESKTAKFDWGLYLIESAEEIHGVMEYNTDLFYASTITRTLQDFQTLLKAIVENLCQPLDALVALIEQDVVSIGDFNVNLDRD
jgi:amino acid adenylation domain-containing protein